MIKKFYRVLFTILGIACGTGISFLISFIIKQFPSIGSISVPVFCGITAGCIIITGIIFYLIAPFIQRSFEKIAHETDLYLQKISLQEFIFGTVGLLIGLIVAFLICQLWSNWDSYIFSTILSILVYLFFAYMGIHIATRKANELAIAFRSIGRQSGTAKISGKHKNAKDLSPKILDTSVIIDGRIADIMKTGFIEGKIVIPEFVLTELRHIADSSDDLKRNRGRRGLDILNKIQSMYGIEIYNTEAEKTLSAIPEVDAKLLELALSMGGKVVTNDYNLNKVAAIKGVPVLNINELANTLKPVVLPNEEMSLIPVKEGKENNQALAYLDDGTMIVVEDGQSHIGEEIKVLVTSVLQTSAGRMIFAKPKHTPKNDTK